MQGKVQVVNKCKVAELLRSERFVDFFFAVRLTAAVAVHNFGENAIGKVVQFIERKTAGVCRWEVVADAPAGDAPIVQATVGG